MKRTACAALLFALAAATPAYGQFSGDPIDPRLRQVWYESEGDWGGRWTPLNPQQPTGAYVAHWTMRGETAQARLQIDIRGGRVTVTRTQDDGRQCHYQGLFNAAGNVVTGTYTCAWSHGALPWRASVGSPSTASASDRPNFDNPQAYLHLEWIVREGAWHGRWTPHNPDALDGLYSAHYVMERESADAELTITIDNTGRVRVERRDPGGRTCRYNGQISTSMTSIAGRYYCTDHPGVQLTWSANPSLPNRPH